MLFGLFMVFIVVMVVYGVVTEFRDNTDQTSMQVSERRAQGRMPSYPYPYPFPGAQGPIVSPDGQYILTEKGWVRFQNNNWIIWLIIGLAVGVVAAYYFFR